MIKFSHKMALKEIIFRNAQKQKQIPQSGKKLKYE